MSAKRTSQAPKRVSFSLPSQSPSPLPSTPTPQRILPDIYTGLHTPDTSNSAPNARFRTPDPVSPTPDCHLQTPNTATPTSNSVSATSTHHLQTPESTSKSTSSNPTGNPLRQPSSKNLVSKLSPNWYFNEQDTALIRAGYEPQWTPNPTDTTPTSTEKGKKGTATKPAMAEPRARMARHKGQMNFQNERKYLQPTRIHQWKLPIKLNTNHLHSPSAPSRLWRPQPTPKLPKRTTSRDRPCAGRDCHRLRT